MRDRSNRRLFGTVSAIILSLALAPTIEAQRAPATPNMIATGCITQAPDSPTAPPTAHEQAAAKGLTLSSATVKSTDGRAVGAPPRSAVPGSTPAGAGSGTTDTASPRQTPPVEQSFWLVGARSSELTRFVGKRVEVAGTIDDRLTPNPGTGAAAADTPSPAHPSAPSRAISVLSFRVLDEHCS